MKDNISKTGRIFTLLWVFTFLVQMVSLQIRLAIFGGTGWLTVVKYVTFSERAGFLSVIALLSASLVGLWVLLGHGISKLFKVDEAKSQRWIATLWVIVIAIDTFFRHKIADLLGSAFNFFEFATGVGGVWRMIEQAFSWYADIIIGAIAGILVVGVGVFFFFRWFLGTQAKWVRFFDRIPKKAIAIITVVCCLFGFVLMSVMSRSFPQTRSIVAGETLVGKPYGSLVDIATDFDGDGYGMFALPADLAPNDPEIHPHAADIPGDGIDQDMLLGDLALSEVPADRRAWIDGMGRGAVASPVHRKNVVIVLMESVRHDMMDAEIGGYRIMPSLNALIAHGALRIDGMYATRGFTQNSVTQTFWGSFYEPETTLVDDFKSMGYTTAVFNGESLLDEGFDVSCGWTRSGDVVVDSRNLNHPKSPRPTAPGQDVMNDVEQYIQDHSETQPMFLYIFYQDPHFPYQQDNDYTFTDRMIHRNEITRDNRGRVWNTYSNQVYYLDKALGRLISALELKGILDDTLIVISSDHGESLFDDGYLLGHGTAFQSVMSHCAMAVWGASHDFPGVLSHIDIRPWILDDLLVPMPYREERLECSLDAEEKSKPLPRPVGKVKEMPQASVLQYLGATSVPSGISFVRKNGDRVVYQFDNGTAYRETNGVKEVIASPGSDHEIRDLIQTWAYMQWKKRGY